MCTQFLFCFRLSYEAPFIGDDYWHHLCAMWDTDTTEWSFYLDGVHQISQTKGHLSGYIVQGGGTFHLGQFVQNGAYKVAKAYQGLITGLNIWTTRLSSRTVAALAEEPGTEKGDALSWSMFRRGITGDVQIYNDYTLEMTGICARSTLPRRRFLGELEIRAPLKTPAWELEAMLGLEMVVFLSRLMIIKRADQPMAPSTLCNIIRQL